VGVLIPLLAAGAWVVWFSPWLTVEEVRVEVRGDAPASIGAFPVGEVNAVVSIPTDTPLARVPAGEIAARVSALPQVRSVDVVRQWPHTVVIDVQRREPVAVVVGAEGYDAVDLEGMVVAVLAEQPADLPLVAGSGAGLPAALAVAAELPTTLRQMTEVIEASTRNDVTLRLDDGAEVLWGSAEQGALKTEVLLALLSPRWDRYDVSSPQVPTTSSSMMDDTADGTVLG
jgi:cell division protein FtsQ